MKRYLGIFTAAIFVLSTVISGCAAQKGAGAYEYDAADAYYETTIANDVGLYTNFSKSDLAGDYDYSDEFYSEEAEFNGAYAENEPSEELPADTVMSAQNYSEKLVYTCHITMQTTEFENTVSALKALIEKYEGFIEYEDVTDSASYWYYEDYLKTHGTLHESITVRVPVESYEAFLSEIEGNGKIIEKSQNVENITREYYNVATTIESLETQEERLLQMMKEAETVEEMLLIEDRLTEVQNELAIYKTDLSEMDTDVDFSTVNLSIEEVLEYTPVEGPVYVNTFAQRLKNTLSDTWDGFLDFLEDALFFLIESFPILLVLGLVNFAVFMIIVRAVRKKRAKKAAAAEETADTENEAAEAAVTEENEEETEVK